MEHEVEGDFGNAWMRSMPRDRHRRLEAGLVRTGPGGHPGAERELLARLGRQPLRADHHPRRRRVRHDAATGRSRRRRHHGPLQRATSSGSTSCSRCRRSTSISATAPRSTYLIMTEAGPLASPEARQAMCYAFPYQEVMDGVYRGYAARANSPVAPEVLGLPGERLLFETDLDKARELLAAAGVPEGTELIADDDHDADHDPAGTVPGQPGADRDHADHRATRSGDLHRHVLR